MKRLFVLALGLMMTFSFSTPLLAHSDAEQAGVRIEVFEREDCTHCIAQKAFFADLLLKRNDFYVVAHDIKTAEDKVLFDQLTELEKIPKVTPTTIIGGVVIQGFLDAETTGIRLIELIDLAEGKEQQTLAEFMAAGGSQKVEQVVGGGCQDGDESCGIEGPGKGAFLVKVPFLGVVDVGRYSLPVLSLVLGFVDGFNPCAMWVLVMLLTILIQAGSKRRMWEMAGLFILAEAIMYYLILTVWMTAWDFIGLDRVVTVIVGLVSLSAGLFFLYQFKFSDGSCKIMDWKTQQKTRDKIHHYATAPMTLLTAVGIIGLALSVNIIEFACSIGIPQAFTKILDINPLSFFGKQFYMALYILMYMVDDLIVFGAALWSFEKIGLTAHKYTKLSHLIGGIIMFIIGLLFLVKPSALIFF